MDFSTVIYIAIIVFLLWLLIKIFKKPIKFIFKMLMNALVGFLVLFILNRLGINLNFSLINALVIGIMGVPGLIILLVIKFIL